MSAESRDGAAVVPDLEALTALNLGFIRAVEAADPDWFDRHLSPDFMNSNPDGSIVDRAAFLDRIARGAGLSNLSAQDVRIRIIDDLAIVHARTAYVTRDGTSGAGRYTDVWLRRGGQWTCVAAHVTRF